MSVPTLNQVFASQAAHAIRGDRYLGVPSSGGVSTAARGRGTPTDKTLRDFAEVAYHAPASYRGYTRSDGISTNETVVYVNPSTRQAIITLRGSQNVSDFSTDTALALGQLSRTPRYRRTVQQVQSAIAHLDGYNISVTGHSLGGSLVRAISGTMRNVRGVAFNTGYSVNPYERYLPVRSRQRPSSNYREYLNNTDVVSIGSYGNPSYSTRRIRYSNGRMFLGAHRARPTTFF